MAKKKSMTNYPYVVVEGVENRLLDYAVIHKIHKDPTYTVSSLSIDSKLMTKLKQQKGNSNVSKKLTLAYNLGNYYNSYNNIVNKVMEELSTTADKLFEQYTSDNFEQYFSDNAPEVVNSQETLDYICEMLTFFRLYKKGRYANEYIPLIVNCVQEQFMPGMVELFEDSADEAEWIDAITQYIDDLVEEPEQLDELDEIDASNVDALKFQMLKLIDKFSETLNIANPKELENLQTELNTKNQELKSVAKQLKNKDEQISKLQKGIATKDKEISALAKKNDELKKLDGTKNAELGALRKTAKEATEKYEQLLKRQESMKGSLQNELLKAREQATQPLQLQLNSLKDEYEMKIEQLEENYKQLQQTVTAEREELHKLEDEVERLRSFQTYYSSLNAEKDKLQTENERLQQELKALKDTLQQKTVTPTPVVPIVQEPDDIVPIDDDIFSLVTNAPKEDESEAAHIMSVAGVSQENEQSGTIGVITDDNEINFDDLLMNRPK